MTLAARVYCIILINSYTHNSNAPGLWVQRKEASEQSIFESSSKK